MPSPIQASEKEYENIKRLEDFQSWINHPYTLVVFSSLNKLRDFYDKKAVKEATLFPTKVDAVLANLNCVGMVDEVVDKLKKPISIEQ